MNTDRIISISLITIWAILIAMGVITLVQPDWLTEMSHEGKNVEAISIIEAGDNFLNEGNFKEAIAQYQKALKIIPDKKGAISNIAIAYQSIGNYNAAIGYYNKLLKLDPEYPSIVYYNIAEILKQINKNDQALKYYKKSATISFDPEKALQKAGSIFMKNKEHDSAIRYFKLALNKKQTLQNSYKSTLIKNQKHLSDSSQKYLDIEKLLKSSAQDSLYSNYDFTIYNEMLTKDINLVKTYSNIGYCLAMDKKYEESIEYLNKALQIDPGFSDAKNNLKAVNELMNQK